MRSLVVGLVLTGCLSAVHAEEGGPKPLPSLALDPLPEPSPWHGLWVGTDIVAAARKGQKGFIGGDVTVGYDRVFANNVILGFNAATGVAPGFYGIGPIRGYDFASAGGRIGYVMGRWTPYVASDLVLARPNSRAGGLFNGGDAINGVLNGSDALAVGGHVGAGFDYALTSDTSIGLGIAVGRGASAGFP